MARLNRKQRRDLEKKEAAKINEMRRLMMENGIRFLQNNETDERQFQHTKSEKFILVVTENVEDDRNALVKFIRELKKSGDL